ncbi:organic hydroperoxide resistance protein [Novosphingobium profundi]|uniref:organic hydroperoxide resistance protein n=1 Tax=Novosphingobium profundi TaxID=1774954 RepID=UPI001BDA3EDC|nr:organic hydroperoxide resistance protein [Novosphingobium profundi]MBT0667441.1 organic hydroperoxide resistance protein [Novosphingobium profundi]
MLTKTLYTTSATSNGGRDGRARTADGSLNVWLDMPVELGGRGHGNNPEQLFAAGYSACFLSAMKTVAGPLGMKVPAETTVTASVGIGPLATQGFGLSIALAIAVPGVEREAAQRLIEAAHEVCPYSNAVRGNIDVALTLA